MNLGRALGERASGRHCELLRTGIGNLSRSPIGYFTIAE